MDPRYAFAIVPLLFLLAIVLFFGLIATVILIILFRYKKRLRVIGDTPVSAVGDLGGGLAKVRGRVVALQEPLVSPLSKTPCVYYRFLVEERRTRVVSSGPHGSSHAQTYWHPVINDRDAVRCAVEDQTGRARVDLLEAETVLDTSAHLQSGLLHDAPPALKRLLERDYGYSTKGLVFNKAARYREEVIQEGDKVFVLGDVEVGNRGTPRFVKGEHPFIVSDRNESNLLTHYRRRITWCYVGLGATAAVGLLFCAFPVFFLLLFAYGRSTMSRPQPGAPVVVAPQDPVAQALNDLRSPDPFARGRAADSLARMRPDAGRREQVVAALKPLLQDNHWYPPQAARRALAVWDPQPANPGPDNGLRAERPDRPVPPPPPALPGPPPPPAPANPPPPPAPEEAKPGPAEAPRPAAPPERPKMAPLPGRPPRPEPEKVAWEVKPDPVPRPSAPINLRGSLPMPFMGLVVYATSPHSTMLAMPPVGSKDKSRLQVYDVRQMKPVGVPVHGPFGGFNQKYALSPDGAYLATLVPGAARSTVTVWSTATGRSLRPIEVDPDPQMKVSMFDFVAGDRLITLKHKGEFVDFEVDSTYQVWDLKTGAEVAHFSTDLRFLPRWGTFSPAREYMVMEHTLGKREGYHIYFWDLATGRLAGDIEFQGKEDPWGQSSGLAFTPDGEKLAMLWRLATGGERSFRLLTFDVKTGRKLHDHKIPNESRRGEYPWLKGGTSSVQWSPDGSRLLLFGYLLVDAESGAVVGKLGTEPLSDNDIVDRRFLDRDHVTALEGTGFDKRLGIMALPRAGMNQAADRAGRARDGLR